MYELFVGVFAIAISSFYGGVLMERRKWSNLKQLNKKNKLEYLQYYRDWDIVSFFCLRIKNLSYNEDKIFLERRYHKYDYAS